MPWDGISKDEKARPLPHPTKVQNKIGAFRVFEMKKNVLIIIAFFLWGCVPNRPFDQDLLTPVPIKQSYISLESNTFFNSRLGSAVLIENGYAITNRHLVEGAYKIKGYMDGGIEFPITEIIMNKKFDLALLKIPLGIGQPIKIGDRINTGEPVYSVGTTYSSTILEGIVRETEYVIHHTDVGIPEPYGRDDAGRPMSRGFIYEGPFINGFSGGPIVNARGELVGINQGYLIQDKSDTNQTGQGKSRSYGTGYHIADILEEIKRMRAQFSTEKPL